MWKDIQKRLDSSESYVSLALGLAVVLVIGALIFNAVSKRNQEQAAKKTDATTNTEVNADKYTVAAGDTLWSIAEKQYNNGYNWVDIKSANPTLPDSNELVVGQELSIPKLTPTPIESGQTPSEPEQTPAVGQISATSTVAEPTPAVAGSQSGQRSYTVVRGDTLWAIAVREYKDGYKWVEIARANHLDNPDLIHSGNVFVLP